MKFALTLLGVFLLVIAATYFPGPVDELPGLMPAHRVGVRRVEVKRGFASSELGLVLIATDVWMGRK